MMTDTPRVTITMNRDDLYFISNCISQAAPSEDERSPEENRTVRKLNRAEDRMYDKEKRGGTRK